MNLRNIANLAIQSINPDKTIIWKRSTGNTVDEHFNQVPSYEEYQVQANIQAVTGETLRQVNNLNISGVLRSVYLSQNIAGISFRFMRGGDILTFSEFEGEDTTDWKVVHDVEKWDNWAHVIVAQQ